MSNTATIEAPAMQLIPTLKIVQVPGMNPRGSFSHDDPEFLQLKASIEERGIETPIKVGPAEIESGDELLHPVIWGNRRHAVAIELGLDVVPAIVDAELDEKGRFLAAVSENIDRADMTPVAEAWALRHMRESLGMKQVEAAKAMRLSERTARDREKLLDMPAEVRAAFAGGGIPLEAIPDLATIAKACPNAAQGIVDRVEKGQFPHGLNASSLKNSTAIVRMLEEVAELAGLVKVVPDHYWNQGVSFNNLPIDKEARAKLAPKWEEVPPNPFGGGKENFKFDEKDGKAAKKAGCLLEFEGKSYITDPAFIADIAAKKLPAIAKEAKRKVELAANRGGKSAADRKKEEERAARKREREKEIFAASNRELADRLNALSNPKATDVNVVRLVCAMALGQDDYLDELISEGLGLLDPDRYAWPDEDVDSTDDLGEQRSPGSTISAELAAAKTAGECMRVVLRVAIASVHGLEPGGHSRRWAFPGPVSGDPIDTYDLVDDVAEALDVLPDAAKKKVKERRAERQKREKARAEAEAEAARQLEKAKGSADKAVELIGKKAGQSTPDLAAFLKVDGRHLRVVLLELEEEGKVKRVDDGRHGDHWQIPGSGPNLGDKAQEVLDQIKAEPGVAASKLAKDVGVKPNTLYRIVGNLEQAGLVTKSGRKYTAVDQGGKEGS
jgi:ParB/RepB/Spo0J family partition protein